MADERQIRKLFNTKQDIIEFKGIPSKDSISEGQIAFAKDPTGRLALFRKAHGKLWKTYMTHNGDQVVDRDLKVGGSLTVRGNLKGAGGSGTINYETGEININAYPNAEFVVSANTKAAHSGGSEDSATTINGLVTLEARSCNQKADTEIRIISLG